MVISLVDDALTKAIDYAIEHHFLEGLFLKLKGDIMSILFKEYTDEEAKDEAVISAKDDEIKSQAERLAQYEKLYGKL